MAYRNTVISYGSVAKFLHWFIFILVSTLLIVGFVMDDIQGKALKGLVYNAHKLTGILVLGLMMFRIAWALTNKKPKLPDHTPTYEKVFAYSIHILLYVLLLLMPLSGWIMSCAAAKCPSFFGLFNLTLPILPNKALANLCGQIHQITAWTIISVLTIHVTAALKHHFLNKDHILKRMLPKVLQSKFS